MKVALCFSGHMRDLNETKNHWLELIKKYDIDVYASFWDIENEELGDTIAEFEKVYTPKRMEVESWDIFEQSTLSMARLHIKSPNSIQERFQQTSEAFGQFSMYYKVWRANLLTKQLGIDYDIVIRARIDTILDDKFELQINDYLNVPMGAVQTNAYPNSEGINDCFAYANPKIMDYYSFILFQMMEYLSQGHYLFPPEHFLTVHFTKLHIKTRFFPTYMMLTRVSKGTQNEMYNGYMSNPIEAFDWSDSKEFLPAPNSTFKKGSIKDDFDKL